METYQIQCASNPQFSGNIFDFVCLRGWSNWFQKNERPDIFYFRTSPNYKLKRAHLHFFRCLGKLWFFGEYLTEDSINSYIENNYWEFNSNKVSCLRFYNLVAMLRWPYEQRNKSIDYLDFKDLKPIDFLKLLELNSTNYWGHVGFPCYSKEDFKMLKFGGLIEEKPEWILKTHSDHLFKPTNPTYTSYFLPENTRE